jgi:hypothetical protein
MVFGSVTLIFILMLILNSFTPLWGDDWWRAVDWGNFFHIFERIREEYMGWTGRVSVLLLTFLFLLKYPGSIWLFNILNSLVFCFLVIGIFRAAVGRFPGKNHQDFVLILLVFCSIWFLSQSFGEAVLWKTGAIAYLWVVTAAIFLLIPYVELLGHDKRLPDTPLRLWGWPVFAFFWAMGLENVSISCSLFMIYSLIAARLNGIWIPRWYWQVTVGQITGTVLLIAAPGNFVRFAAQDDGQPIWLRMGKLAEHIWRHGTIDTHIFVVIAGLLVVLALLRQRYEFKRFYLWMIIGLMFAFTMAGSTGINFADRTAFVAEICFIAAMTNLIHLTLSHLQPLYIFPLPTLMLVLAIWGADFVKTFDQYLATWHQTQRRAELMEIYRDNGIRKILLPSMSIPHINELKDNIVDRRYFLRDIHPDQDGNGWRNGTYAKYHGFTFAERIQKPDMIYAPELENTKRFKPRGKYGDFELFSRLEKRGINRSNILYLIGNKRNCRAVKEVQVYPADIDDLNSREQKTRHVSIKNETPVAWVSERGVETKKRCIARFNMPDWDIEKVVFSHASLSWPHKATINWSELSVQNKQATKPAGRLEWKACELSYSKQARVDIQRCTVASRKNISGHLIWGPYVRLKQGLYRISAHYSAKSNGAKWEIVVQTKKGPRVLADGILNQAQNGTFKRDFEIDEALKNKPLEFRITPEEARDIELAGITIDPLDINK